MTFHSKPFAVPRGMSFKKMLELPVSQGKWRESPRYLCNHCMSNALHHPYTNDIWGCRHCETTTTQIRANFFSLEGDEHLPVETRAGTTTPFEPAELLDVPEEKQLPEYAVVLKRVPKGKRAVNPADRSNQGRRTKLGGLPDWIQADIATKCDSCDKRMTFVAQIDSIEHISTGNPIGMDMKSRDPAKKRWMFGDVGMIYVFYCFQCSVSASIVQDY